MKALDNTKTGVKLIGAFVIVAALAVAIGGVGIYQMGKIDAEDTALYERMTVPIGHLQSITASFQRGRTNLAGVLLVTDPAAVKDQADKVAARSKEVDDAALEFEKLISSDTMREAFAEFTATRKAFAPLRDQVIALAHQGKRDEATALFLGAAYQAVQAEQAAIEKLTDMKLKDAKAKSDANTATFEGARSLMFMLMAIGGVLALALGFIISRSISAPLAQGVHMIQELALGHLGLRLKMNRKDEVGVLAAAMDAFADDLQVNVVGTMKKIAAGDLTTDVTAQGRAGRDRAGAQGDDGGAARPGGRGGDAVEGGGGREAGDPRRRGQVHQGDYREIVQGVNDTLDAVIGPLNVAAEYVDRISKGDIPPKITDTYNGDFNEIKNNLNQCIDAVNALVADAAHAGEGGGGGQAGDAGRCGEAPGRLPQDRRRA